MEQLLRKRKIHPPGNGRGSTDVAFYAAPVDLVVSDYLVGEPLGDQQQSLRLQHGEIQLGIIKISRRHQMCVLY